MCNKTNVQLEVKKNIQFFKNNFRLKWTPLLFHYANTEWDSSICAVFLSDENAAASPEGHAVISAHSNLHSN